MSGSDEAQREAMALQMLRTAPAGLGFGMLERLMASAAGDEPLEDVLSRLDEKGLVEKVDGDRWRLAGQTSGSMGNLLNDDGDRGTGHLGGRLPDVPDHGAPTLPSDGTRYRDPLQQRVIGAPVEARLVVEAGPGFGKTEVACARVATLIEDEGVEPASILLLSFTRTAVKEMRCRIRELAAKGVDVDGVGIRTLDSFAWWVRTASEASVGDVIHSHDDSIRLLADRLESPGSDLLDLLEGYEHVFIDEAQDLHGSRVDLVAGLLEALPDDCGWTVFLDPAQAIYGWSEHEDAGPAQDHVSLIDRLGPHEQVRLETLFRTRDPDLRQLLLGGRRLVLDDRIENRAERLREELEARQPGSDRKAIGDTIKALRMTLEDDEARDAFVLFRTRAQALDASSWLCAEGKTPHRLRLGGMPTTVSPWVAVVVAGASERAGRSLLVGEADVRGAFDAIDNEWLTAGWSSAEAFQALRSVGRGASGREIDLRRVADAIASRRHPDDLFHREVGTAGPIIGTVHGSKGREAKRVILTVPPLRDDSSPEEELGEARVLYVGLSRAKEQLEVRRVRPGHWGRLENGRVWSRLRRGNWKVEVGRDGDVDPGSGLVGLSAGQVAAQQAVLGSYDGAIRDLELRQERDREWRWQIHGVEGMELGEAPFLAELGSAFGQDVWNVLRLGRRNTEPERLRPSSGIRWVRWFDLTTVALPRDQQLLREIPQPWQSLRIWLSPVVSGLGVFYSRGF